MVKVDFRATGIRIYQLMADKGLNPDKVASKMGLAKMSVYKWTYGTSFPRIEHLVELSDLLEVPIEEILVVERR